MKLLFYLEIYTCMLGVQIDFCYYCIIIFFCRGFYWD